MEDIKEVIDEETVDPPVEGGNETETPEVPDLPAGSKLPIPNADAVTYREKVVTELENDIPKVVDAVVTYIEGLIRTRSDEGEPVVTVNVDLLNRAYNKGFVYPDYDKALILAEACDKYAKQGYDVTERKFESKPTVPEYVISLKREKENTRSF